MKAFKPSGWMLLVLLLVVVLAVRTPFILGDVLGGDAAYHARAAVTVLNGGLLYHDVPYTYPPLYAYTEALAIALFGNTGLGWKATSQIYDLGIIVLIYLIVNRISSKTNALIAAALYGFSPLPFFATSSFASFDSTAAFWMLASILLLMMKKPVPSAVALGIGTAYKYFPLLLLPAAIFYLVSKRQKIWYTAVTLGTVALIQLPFILTAFNDWLNNVIIFHVNRPASGATIYNLVSLHPQIWDVQTPLTFLSPITLVLVFLLVALSEGKSDLGLLKSSAFIMVAAVFFSKVVLFYALWYVPLICILLLFLRRRLSALLFLVFLVMQVDMVVGGTIYTLTLNEQIAFAAAYIYLFTSGILLVWLLYDRLISARETGKYASKPFRNL